MAYRTGFVGYGVVNPLHMNDTCQGRAQSVLQICKCIVDISDIRKDSS